ncbi:unnamed protein product [Spirodela intermedia]|uniref:Uncharacterized protein n=1 Tax=Spirodela intermedia TaxID=51605 RepID=A0A7I8IGE1_SPIIN|nr:unnamed protein product [Spirodela intermedia]CAA6656938.1 unnamed protein product [Spirodela intermedia]
MRVLRSDVGAGRSLLALLRLAVVESLLQLHRPRRPPQLPLPKEVQDSQSKLRLRTRWCCG